MRLFIILTICVSVCLSHGHRHRHGHPKKVCRNSAQAPSHSSGCCGVEATNHHNILNGRPTAVRQYPWLALMEYRIDPFTGTTTVCGGFLISGMHVITAAHCVDSPPISVRLGEHDRTNNVKARDCTKKKHHIECTKGAFSIPVQRVIAHPDFKKDPVVSLKHDIALLKLASTAKFTEFIRPICLPKSDVTKHPPSKLKLYATGWGKTSNAPNAQVNEVKSYVILPYIKLADCQKYWHQQVWEKQICAGGEAGKDTCGGDSGGPLMNEHDGVFEAVGIVSFGSGDGCGTQKPTVFTKVHSYVGWIKRHM